jgi:hypothetical protein
VLLAVVICRDESWWEVGSLWLKWSSQVSSGARCQARGKIVLNAWEDLLDDKVTSSEATEVTRVRSIPLPISLDLLLSFQWCSFGTKIEHPSRDESAQNWDVGNNNGDIVFDMIDAEVDRVGPVRLVKEI